MKGIFKFVPITCLLLTTFTTSANIMSDQNSAPQGSENTEDIKKYLKYLGGYLGYDITKDPKVQATVSATLLNPSAAQLVQNYLFTTFLGAVPVTAISQALMKFVPNNVPGSSTINMFANTTYANYASSSAEQSGISANGLIDQQTFQADPTSQAILNILGTPDFSTCIKSDGVTLIPNCPILYQEKVMSNVLGELPASIEPGKSFYSFAYNQPLLSQLNTNSLLGPLMYSTQSTGGGQNSNSPGSQGLTAQNQEQQAANFIRYASGAVAPIAQPKLNDYMQLYAAATQKLPDTPTAEQLNTQQQAKQALNSYFTGLRIYAAQASVGLSNLYYILSKRISQNQSTEGNTPPTSQALSEFNMATWRIKPSDPNSPASKEGTWMNQINNASSATVQKEIAILLAEINYQLYLSRQQEERVLLTHSLMLLQNTKANQPTPFSVSTSGEPVTNS